MHDVLCNQVKKSVIQVCGGFTQLNFLKVAQRINQSWDLVICNMFFVFSILGVGVFGPKNQVPRPQQVGDSKRSFPAQRLNWNTKHMFLDFAFLRLKL